MYKDKRVEKKKTVVMKRCLNPVFNESFAFDIPTERLRETTIVITVMDKDRLSRNDVIGKVGPAALARGGGTPAMRPAERWHRGDGHIPGWWRPVLSMGESWDGAWGSAGGSPGSASTARQTPAPVPARRFPTTRMEEFIPS